MITLHPTAAFSLSVKVNLSIPTGRIRDLLCGALEGGSNYWAAIKRYKIRKGLTLKDFKDGEGHMTRPDGEYWPSYLLAPFAKDCGLVIVDREGEDPKEYTLDMPAMRRGIQVMADKYPRHFSDFLTENDDADTSDVFLQCCLFGEIVYG